MMLSAVVAAAGVFVLIWAVSHAIKRQDQDELLAAARELLAAEEQNEAQAATLRAYREALDITPDDCGRIMHESWMRTKRAQGFHHANECEGLGHAGPIWTSVGCRMTHADLIPWDQLPEPQKYINRHAFDDVLTEIRRRATPPTPGATPGEE